MPAKLDKKVNSAYLWCSPATDVTGRKLAETLGMQCGTAQPKNASLVVCWGAKTKEAVSLGKTPVMNHPDKIRLNRNKFSALQAMEKAGVSVAPFVSSEVRSTIGTKKCPVTFPCVGRTNYHQGGKGFWDCPTPTHVAAAAQEGAQYFQNLIEIKDEFRLHVFQGVVIYAAKKVKRSAEETAAAYVRQELEKQKNIAAKKGTPFDEATAKSILEQQAKVFAQNGANMLIRSNRAGWKFSRLKTVDKALETEAGKALKALGLDFGAVDCCVDASGKVFILEVNTGPGLEESTFEAWVAAFTTSINDILNPKTVLEKANEKIFGKKEAAAAPTTSMSATAKTSLKEKLKLMDEMVDVADDTEAAILERVFSKMLK